MSVREVVRVGVVDAAQRGAGMKSMLVRNGVVVNWFGRVSSDVYVANGKVASLQTHGQPMRVDAEVEIDAGGKLLLPGGVDPHCHVGFTSGGVTTRDGYEEATLAAVFGGTTTIVDFAIPARDESPVEAAVRQQGRAAGGLCDSLLHACVVKWDNTVPDQIHTLADMGIRTVKMFTTYRGDTMASDDTILRVMRELAGVGGMAYVHCEANHLIEAGQEAAARRHHLAAEFHAESRSASAEVAAVAGILATAEALAVPVYLVHLSTGASLRLTAAARAHGQVVFSEVTPHHLVLDESAYHGASPERFVCCPPLRSVSDVAAVRRGVWNGAVSTVGSDHCCYDSGQKALGKSDVRTIANGLPGVETRVPLLLSELSIRGTLPLERIVELCCMRPALANGLWPRKGGIWPGADADMVLWDPSVTRAVRASELHMATDFSPYEGIEVTGWPDTVIVGGRVVVRGGVLVDAAPRGRVLGVAPLHFDGVPAAR